MNNKYTLWKKLPQMSLWAFVLIASLFFAACSGGEGTGDGGTTPDGETGEKVSQKVGYLRVSHMSYDAPAVDISVDGTVVVEGLKYGESSAFLEVPMGERTLLITPAGKTDKLYEDKADVSEGARLTVMAYDKAESLKVKVLSGPAEQMADKALVRFVHASPDAPKVDIKAGDPESTAIFGGASFGDVTEYKAVDEAEYEFVVTAAGDTKAVISFEKAKLEKGKRYTVFARGTFDAQDSVDFGVRVFVDNDEGKTFLDLKAKTPAPAEMSKVRVFHMSYDAPNVDVSVDGNVAISDLGFGMSSGYAELPSGERAVKVTPTGKTEPVVIDAKLNLEAKKDYSVFAIGALKDIKPLVVVDERAPAAGKAKIRLVHAAPDAPAVDVKAGDPTASAAIGNIAFGKASDYIELDPGEYSFVVTAAGDTKAVVTFEKVKLEADKIYTAVAHGTLDGQDSYDFGVRVFVDNEEGKTFLDLKAVAETKKVSVRVIHTSHDAPNVDVSVDGSVAIGDLGYGTSSGYAMLPVGERVVKVTPTGKTEPVVIDAKLTLEEGKEYTVLAVGELSSIAPVVVEDERAPSADKVKIRFVHASPDAPAVDIKVADPASNAVFANAKFKDATKYIEVDEGEYEVVVTAAGDTKTVISFDKIKLEKGKVYTVVAHGTLDANDNYNFGVRAFIDNGDGKTYADLNAKSN